MAQRLRGGLERMERGADTEKTPHLSDLKQ